MPLAPSYIVAIGAICVAFFYFVALPRRRRAAMFPPGPPRDLVIGHLRYMPSADSALVFHEWAKTYGSSFRLRRGPLFDSPSGDVIHLQVLGRSIIILDTYQAAVDLLDKRGLNYSDRPNFTLYELLGWNPTTTFLRYGKQWAKHRQMHHSYLNHQKADDFKPMQIQEARTLVLNLMESSPDRYESFLSRFATAIVTQIVAGHRVTSDNDPYLHTSKMIVEMLTQTGPPGGSPIDFFPVLQHFPSWFPGAGHVGVAKVWRPTLRELHDNPLETESGDAMPSFILAQLEKMEDNEDENDLKGAAATMFAAGESTTWGTLAVFLLAMVLHPECQVKAREEISSVVGDSRLPDFEDREKLPFIECIMQETFRRISLQGVPHRAMEDDMYRGMLVPKGAIVFSNIKGMALDERVYSDPASFYPERYLPTPVGKSEPYFTNTVFGFGRRICTGQYVADNSVWIAIATILASCTIANAVDEHGNIIVLKNVLTEGLIRQVNPQVVSDGGLTF
ncbi:cytochrome P450 CYP621A2 [Mycena epipterygia]|nr:cytochrome P450 CYP621A2 [Mycena epipterygia]